MELCAGLLRKEFRDETAIADLTTEMNRDAAFEEKDITAYLLRRNFATAMVSVCGMEEDELQYLMGHDILDEQEMRSDFTDADFLARLWHKMNRRVLRDNMYLVIDQAECMVEGRNEIRAEITESCFADAGDTVILDVWNELPGDYISVQPNRDAAAVEENIMVDASYEPMQAQRAGRINIEQEYRDAVRKVRNRSKTRG